MLYPKETKYRKRQKGRIKGKASKGTRLAFGAFGLKAIESGLISDRQIEASRISMARYMKREGKVWLRIFPDKPITRKPLEVRMGKGKGDLDHYAAVIKPGRIIYEIGGVPTEVAQEAFRLASHKLPLATKFIVRRDYTGE